MSEWVSPIRMRDRSLSRPPASLTRQFALTGSAIMLVAMMTAGLFIAEMVSKATIENTASATALLLDSILEPLTQDLVTEEVLPAKQTAELDQLLGEDQFKERFPYLEIWKASGLIAYSTTPSLVGQRFTPPEGLVRALEGKVSAQYADGLERSNLIRNISGKYLEIYIPLREDRSGRVIAVAEIHESTASLEHELWWLRLKSWLVVGGATALIMMGLFGIVYRGNQLILLQRRQLQERLVEIEQTNRHNRILRDRARRASGRVAELTEDYLRRIGADLHDGPAQFIGLAALSVEHVRRAQAPAEREKELESLSSMLLEALRDIRTVSKGLMLPEIEGLPLPDIIGRVVSDHERRTGTKVDVHCGEISGAPTDAIKICAYRFLQEGLNNAFRHAGGNGQAVTCTLDGSALHLAVQDDGGTGTSGVAGLDFGLGLIGLRERVESLGGVFCVSQRTGGGTRVEMTVAIAEESQDG
ncbi:sensor histidine kinase [Microvirga sp. VF16]|uniref:sensor histidine kinase n=1 Tax=Microvirga sp. VF16 TaxID=2807101 RepID=UPI00193D1A85|nr:histidine kinase [Microvirga sp. VF16]QRM35196.1 histidine kinase [Microvirga sp. VF16]